MTWGRVCKVPHATLYTHRLTSFTFHFLFLLCKLVFWFPHQLKRLVIPAAVKPDSQDGQERLEEFECPSDARDRITGTGEAHPFCVSVHVCRVGVHCHAPQGLVSLWPVDCFSNSKSRCAPIMSQTQPFYKYTSSLRSLTLLYIRAVLCSAITLTRLLATTGGVCVRTMSNVFC